MPQEPIEEELLVPVEGRELLELVSHDLINQQQAALGFLEMLEDSSSLSDGERALLLRTVEALEHATRLMLQVRTAIIERDEGAFRLCPVRLDRAVEAARETVQGAFAKGRLEIEAKGLSGGPEVVANDLLADMLVQLFLLLGDAAPQDRRCRLRVEVEEAEMTVALRLSSEGFALNPMTTEALTGGRLPQGWSRNAASVSLVQHLLRQYDAEVRMEPAPTGMVGAQLVIELPLGRVEDAVDNGRR